MSAGSPSQPPPVFVDDADGLDPNLILADMIAESRQPRTERFTRRRSSAC